MIERPATFLGWGFPALPAGAQLVYVRAQLRVPAAGVGTVIDGAAPLGGTGYLVSRAALERGASRRVRLLAVGFGLWDFQRHYDGNHLVLAGTSIPVNTLLTLTGSVDEPLEELRLEATGAGLMLRVGAGGVDFASVPAAGITLRRCHVGRDLIVNNATGGNITVRAYGTRLECAKASQVQVLVRRVSVTPDGTVTGALSALPDGLGWPRTPQPLPYGQEPSLIPVVPDAGAGFCDLGDGDAFAVGVSNGIEGDVPESATVAVRLVLAVWQEGQQS